MKISGFIFGKEFWGASDDRMSFVKLTMTSRDILNGEIRFDLNGHLLKMDFSNLSRTSKKIKGDVGYPSPIEFLEYLAKNCCKMITIVAMPKDWIKEKHIPKIKEYLNDKRKSSSVYNPISSHLCGESTVSQEAAYMIKGYREKKYPPGLCSTDKIK